jgi:hypothetical protein
MPARDANIQQVSRIGEKSKRRWTAQDGGNFYQSAPHVLGWRSMSASS